MVCADRQMCVRWIATGFNLMIDVAIHDDQFTDTVNRHTAPHHHRYIASTTKTHTIPGQHCIAILSPDPNTTIIKVQIKLGLVRKHQPAPVVISVPQSYSCTPANPFRRFSTPIKVFLLAILLCIFILFRRRFVVLGHVSTPMFSFHRAFIRPMDQTRCSSARCRRAISPLVVIFLLLLTVSWNLFQTRETVLRQICIRRAIRRGFIPLCLSLMMTPRSRSVRSALLPMLAAV